MIQANRDCCAPHRHIGTVSGLVVETTLELPGRRPWGARTRPNDENAMIAEAQRGSADAIEWIVRHHWPRAHRTAYLIVHDASAAEDIAQESLLAALGALDRFDRARKFAPWLHRIVVNNPLAWARAPDGPRFEVVSYRGSGSGFLPRRRGAYSRICVDINLIDPNRALSSHCAALPPRGLVTIQSATTGLGLGPGAASTIEGTVPRRTARVAIRGWSGAPVRLASPIHAVLAPVREPLVTRIDASRPFDYYVGFLPRGVRVEDVRVVALDRAGDVIGRDRIGGGRATYPGAYAPGTTNFQNRDLPRGQSSEPRRGPGSHGS